MEEVKSLTIRRRLGQVYLNSYLNSDKYTLDDCYTSHYSSAKYYAYHRCHDLRKKYNGHDMKITSYNGWTFQIGFVFKQNHEEWFGYITKDHFYICPISKII